MAREPHLILVVDDDHDLRESLREILESEGFATMGASNGEEVLEFLSTGDHQAKIILLDLMMPKMTGMDVVEHLRRDVSFPSIGVVLMTAFRTLVRKGERTRVLLKPFKIEELLAAIRRARRC